MKSLKNHLIPLFILAIGVAFSGMAIAEDAAAPAKAPAKTATKKMVVAGEISAVDNTAKTLEVKDAKGKTYDMTMTDATKVTGGELAMGKKVRATYTTDADGKMSAAAVTISRPPARKKAAAPATK